MSDRESVHLLIGVLMFASLLLMGGGLFSKYLELNKFCPAGGGSPAGILRADGEGLGSPLRFSEKSHPALKTNTSPSQAEGQARSTENLNNIKDLKNMANVGTLFIDDAQQGKGRIDTRFFAADILLEPVNQVGGKIEPNGDKPAFEVVEITPDGRRAMLGAAWLRKAKIGTGKTYLSISMDDPSFRHPLHFKAFQDKKEGEYSLVWERTRSAGASG